MEPVDDNELEVIKKDRKVQRALSENRTPPKRASAPAIKKKATYPGITALIF